MTNDEKLMQQALETLEFFAHMKSVSEDTMRLITALRERLAQPVQEPVATVVKRQYEDGTYAGNALDWAGRNCEDDFPVGTKLYTDPQPVKFNCTVIDDAHLNGVPLSKWGKQHEMQPCAGRNCGSTNPNLHSAECFEDYEKATGMNQWVGLTDEAIWLEYQRFWPFHPADEPRLAQDIAKFARAIEAKLKEKNT